MKEWTRHVQICRNLVRLIGQRLVRKLGKEKDVETYQSNQLETASINRVVGDLLPKTKADVARLAEDLGYDNLPLGGQNAYTLYRPKIRADKYFLSNS